MDKLSPDERAKAEELLRKLKQLRGEYGFERRMEVRQYFQEKSWIFPKQELWTPRAVIGCLIMVALVIVMILIFSG
ncbi:MAG: hypothetical protein VCA36_07035 [Opitutales bacterium]